MESSTFGGILNVFPIVHVWGRGRGSGIEIDDLAYIHFKVRNGKVDYFYEYEARAEALEAAGLSEWAMSEEKVEHDRLRDDA